MRPGLNAKHFRKSKLAHDADDVVAIADRIAVEIIRVEHSLQFAHGGLARDGLHRARHVLPGGGFEKSMHGGSSSLSISSTGQERAAAQFSCKVAGNATEHPFAEARVAIGAGNHGACPDIGSDLLELFGDIAGLFGNERC